MARRPPLEELRGIIETTGYEVISIEPEHSGLKFSGAINIQIAPREWLENANPMEFPQISQELVSSEKAHPLREGRINNGFTPKVPASEMTNTLHGQLAALSVAVEKIQGELEEMGGKIWPFEINLRRIVQSPNEMLFSCDICFDVNRLLEYAAQADRSWD